MLLSQAGCTQKKEKTSGQNTKLEGNLISSEPMEMSIFYHERNSFVFDNEWPVFKKAAEMTNISLKSVVPKTTTSSTEAFNLMMAGGELADIIHAPSIYIQKYAAEGAFIPLNDLIEEHAPNIKHQLEINEDFRKIVTSEDGNIYFVVQSKKLPDNPEIKYTTNNGYYIRKDWLDKLGLEIPDTMDELVAVWEAFRDKDPNGNGQKDEIPFFANAAEELERIAINYYGGRISWYVDDEGKIRFGKYDPVFKDAIKLAAKWYREGLADKEIFTRGSNSRDILLGNNVGGSVRAAFDSTASYNDKFKDKIEGFNLVPMLPPKNMNGERIEGTSAIIGAAGNIGGCAISYQNENPVEAIKYLDFWFSEEGGRLAEFGIEGEHYDMVDGLPVLKDSLIKGNDPAISQLRAIGAQQLLPCYYSREAAKQWTNEIALEGTKMYEESGCIKPTLPSLNFNVEESETIDAMLGSIVTYMSEMEQKWILGDGDVDAEFDTYMSKMKAMGMDECIAAYQSAYDRYMSK